METEGLVTNYRR